MAHIFHSTLLLLLGAAVAATQAPQLANKCPGYDTETVVCIERYASVLPLPFYRPSIIDNTPYNPANSFNGTTVADASFDPIYQATFLVFETARGTEILGPSPSLEVIFDAAPPAVLEAPVYIPCLNAIIFSALGSGIIPQLLLNLTTTPPTLSNYTTTPPVYGVNGGRSANGTVFWAAGGGNFTTPDGTLHLQSPGLYSLDPSTRTVTTLLNNYYGQSFSGPDDLVVLRDTGDILFTDLYTAFPLNFTTSLPTLTPAIYRWRRATGQVSAVDTTLANPNGIALSPDQSTLYVSDAGAFRSNLSSAAAVPRFSAAARQANGVYAFDLVDSPAGKYLGNKRLLWYPEQLSDDGFHVAGDGTLVGAAGFSVDVLSEWGELLVKIQTAFYVSQVQFVGCELWLFGPGTIAKVSWALEGQEGGAS